MKIRYMSDLHLEFGLVDEVESIGEDVVILAGDIHVGVAGIHWAQRVFGSRPVIYVLGNHEFYKHDWDELILEARAAALHSNVHFLERDAVTIGGVRFLGCSLWTDFRLWGLHRQMEAMGAAGREMSDYHVIRRRGRSLLPVESVERHQESVKWLKERLSENVPTVVVTHHAPTEETSDPKHRDSILVSAYHSRLDDLVRPPALAWIHGHTHFSTQTVINGVPVLVNTFGYPGHYEDSGFSWNACFEVSP